MLTKTDLLSFRQCERKLWLQKHQPDLAPGKDSTYERRSRDGALVEKYVHRGLPGPLFTMQHSADLEADAKKAAAILQKSAGGSFIEVPLVANGLYIRADAILPTPDGLVLQETKASTFPLKRDMVTPDAPESVHLEDIAIQAWVLEQTGLPLLRAELNLLDNKWTYEGDDDYDGLFRQMDVTDLVESKKTEVVIWLKEAQNVLEGPMPAKLTGAQCKKPYSCEFQDHCATLQPPGPAHPIELLPDAAGKALAKRLKADLGYVSILEPAPHEFTGANAELYLRIQNAHATGKEVKKPGAALVLGSLPYPRYYFDFEGIDLPVPIWRGIRPYEQIPFQWSCHVERAPGVFEHYAFLDVSGEDPSLKCAQRLKEVIDPSDNGPIIVFYQTYEKGRLEGIAKRHPEFKDLMDGYISRLVDLHPLVKKHYYAPSMEGSFSIKKVLPAIAPDMDYSLLDEVQEGTGAQIAYLNYCFNSNWDDDSRERLRQAMLTYCEQDTWAMVEVAYFLEDKNRPNGLKPVPDKLLNASEKQFDEKAVFEDVPY